MYITRFKNTFLVDILEYCNIVEIKECLPTEYNIKSGSDFEGVGDLEQADDITKNGCIESSKSFSCSHTDECSHGSQCISDASDANGVKNLQDPFLVTWNGDHDHDYPLNWSNSIKALLIFEIMIYSCINYMGSSIYTPGQEEIQDEFHVGHVTATLNLSLYVLGYGLGQVILAPLSEVAKVGRQQIYSITFLLFTVFQIGCAAVPNIGGLMVMRFLSGIFCSPSLSTAGASIADIIKGDNLPTFTGLWSIGCVMAPVMAPLLGACMVVAKGWRWIFWFLFFVSVACWILLILFFPETSHSNILARRAQRLRKQTGDSRYYTVQERADSQVKPGEFMVNTLYRPFKMIMQEPILLTFDIYIALVYGTQYLFFESFPLVFIGIYHFSLIEMGVAYMGFCVGSFVAYFSLLYFLKKVVEPSQKDGTFKPEVYLILVMWVSWCFPLSMFLFGWAAGTHWIVPIVAEFIFIIACFHIFQATFAYFAHGYPRYVASVYAGNGVIRALFACAFPLFGTAMYNNLAIDGYPIGWGSSIIGFFMIAFAIVPFFLYKYGPMLRSRSKFTG